MIKKRARRLYRLDGLQLCTRIRRREQVNLQRGCCRSRFAPHERRSTEQVHDQLIRGRPIPILTAVDQLSRESSLFETDFAMSVQRTAGFWKNAAATSPLPCRSLSTTARSSPPRASTTAPGDTVRRSTWVVPANSWKSGWRIASFDGRLPVECLNINRFMSPDDACAKIEARRVDYNLRRPRNSLDHLTLSEFVRDRQGPWARRSAGL